MSNKLNLTSEQASIRTGIKLRAGFTGAIWAGLATTAVWFGFDEFVKGTYEIHFKYSVAIATFSLVFLLSFFPSYWLRKYRAKCKKCRQVFSVSRRDKVKNLVSAVPKRRRQVTSFAGDSKRKIITVENWTDERYEIIETYTCCLCGHSTKKKSITKRDANKTTDVENRR